MKKGHIGQHSFCLDYVDCGIFYAIYLISIQVWGIGYRLFSSRFYHNLLMDRRNRLHTFFLHTNYNSLSEAGKTH